VTYKWNHGHNEVAGNLLVICAWWIDGVHFYHMGCVIPPVIKSKKSL
jgi:hypothetical protein